MDNQFIKENFLTRSIAERIVNAGFNEHCFGNYVKRTLHKTSSISFRFSNDDLDDRDEILFPAPTFQQALKFLRDKHRICITEDLTKLDFTFMCTYLGNKPFLTIGYGRTYEEGLNMAIDKALDIEFIKAEIAKLL